MAATGNEIIIVNGDEITLNELVTMVYDILNERSTDVSQFPVATSLTGVNSLPALRMAGNTPEVVTVSISLLKGADGKSIETRITTGENAAWEYRLEDGDWISLMSIADIQRPAIDAAESVAEAMGKINEEWSNVLKPKLETSITDAEGAKEAALSAAEKATSAAANVKDGKTPVFTNGSTTDLPHGQPSSLTLVATGNVDENGNPIYQFRSSIQAGQPGKSFNILGRYDTLEQLKSAIPDGSAVDGSYAVGLFTPYNYYIWGYNVSTQQSDWIDQGFLEGSAGEAGKSPYVNTEGFWVYYNDETGEYITTSIKAEGKDGLSAYQQALNDGFEGSLTEWLKSLRGESWRVPDIDHIPGANDINYVDGDSTVDYPIGGEVRFYDSAKEKYVFYKLSNILGEGDSRQAEWNLSGSGEDLSHKEVIVSASEWISSEGVWKAEINGLTEIVAGSFSVIKTDAVVTINPTPIIESGKIILTTIEEITEDLTFIIDVIAFGGTVTSGVVVTNGGGGSADLRETVTISLHSNQGQPDPALNGIAVNIIEVGTDNILFSETWQGTPLTTKINPPLDYRVSVSSLNGYAHPEDQFYTGSIQGFRSINFYFNTEVLTIQISKDDGESVDGLTVQITNVGSEVVIANLSSGQSIKIPYGIEYRLSPSTIEGYNSPSEVSLVASETTRLVSLEYQKLRTSYITIDQSITDPATMISGDVNGEVIRWIKNNSHSYLGKYTVNGQMTVCQLDDNTRNRYSDGSPAIPTGSEGDVWMKLPRFFYHAEETETDIWKIGFSFNQVDDTWKEWDGMDLIGTYESNMVENKAYSRSGVVSTPSISQEAWKTFARARGMGYSLVKWKHHCIMAVLYYAIYGHMNSQAIVGAGVRSANKINGQTDSLGMTDTSAETNGNTQSINFFGLENWWGNKSELIDNVVVNSGVLNVQEDDGTVRTIQAAVTDGLFIRKTVIGEHLDIVIKSTETGSSTTGYCDYQGIVNNNNLIVRRSYNNADLNGGISYLRAGNNPTYVESETASRIAFRGEIIEAESVEAFKAIPITN